MHNGTTRQNFQLPVLFQILDLKVFSVVILNWFLDNAILLFFLTLEMKCAQNAIFWQIAFLLNRVPGT
jgi:hypothetical protein